MHFEGNYTSMPASILNLDDGTGTIFSKLVTAIKAPHDFAGIHSVTMGCTQAIAEVITHIGSPSSELQSILTDLQSLEFFFADTLNRSATVELQDPLPRCKGKFLAWTAFASLKGAPSHALIAAGVELLLVWGKDTSSVKDVAAQDIRNAIRCTTYTPADLRRLLDGGAATQNAPWEHRLRRNWRTVVGNFSAGLTPPAQNLEDLIRGQIRAAVKYADPQKRAGAINHRQLSSLQMTAALKQIADWLVQDDYRGLVGYLVCSTGLSVRLIDQIPLLGPQPDSVWTIALDLDTAHLKTDLSVLTTEAAQSGLPGVIPASFTLSKPIPTVLAKHLRERFNQFPQAKTLADLYPDSDAPDTHTAVVNMDCEITPSWAKLRSSTGTYLRHIGLDNLLASLVSGDLGHVPNSKFYYAVVSAEEIHQACSRFYQAAGWGTPVASPSSSLHFGCQAVPSADHVMRANTWLTDDVQKSIPGRNCGLRRLQVHHNRFISLCGFRLLLLLALRERKTLPLHADFNEADALWIGIHDKDVTGLNGPLPVPMSTGCRVTIGSVRKHCRALHRRLEKQGEQHSALAQWCRDVVQNRPVHLLMHVGLRLVVNPLGTSHILKQLPQHLRLAPDFGRKVIENHLRYAGLKSTDIDSVLRHTVAGQSSTTTISDFNVLSWIERVVPAIDHIANQMLGDVLYGLSSE